MDAQKELLTIAIPTYNRASLLDRQLAWFAKAVEGNEHRCELFISDNSSTDDTPEVVAKWRPLLERQQVTLRIHRNAENIGAVRNIAHCLEEAHGYYSWVIGDDDVIDPNAIRFVLESIDTHPDLTLLILNFSSRHRITGRRNYDRCFEAGEDEITYDGQSLYERYLSLPRWGGLVLTTALVYRTATVQAGMKSWPDGRANGAFQLYFTAHCAQRGKVILTKDVHLEMAAGIHHFAEDRSMFFAYRVAEIPEAFVKLAELGYSRDICKMRIRDEIGYFRPRTTASMLAKQPLFAAGVLMRYLAAAWRVRSTKRVGQLPEATGYQQAKS